jgi:serine/threonine protein kinase
MDFSTSFASAPIATDPLATLSPNLAHLRRLAGSRPCAAGHYTLGGLVGAGSMGAVVLARPRSGAERVAMKVRVPRGGAEEGRRFLEEAALTQSLRHPNIIPVYEIGVNERDEMFYTMALGERGTLRTVLEALRARVPEALERYRFRALLAIFLKVCDAIAYAHHRGVLHLDLKPENIVLGEFGEVYVVDWGLACPLARETTSGGDAATRIVRERRALRAGTPAYMSPEQAEAGGDLDERSDVFALGAILYQLITLDRPFPGHDAETVLANIRTGAAEPPEPRLRKLRASGGWHLPADLLPELLSALAMRALSPAREARPRQVKQLQREVESCF